MRFRRASCTVWIVALLPEPWNAISVGFVGLPELDMLGGVVLRVKKVVDDPSAAMYQADKRRPECGFGICNTVWLNTALLAPDGL